MKQEQAHVNFENLGKFLKKWGFEGDISSFASLRLLAGISEELALFCSEKLLAPF